MVSAPAAAAAMCPVPADCGSSPGVPASRQRPGAGRPSRTTGAATARPAEAPPSATAGPEAPPRPRRRHPRPSTGRPRRPPRRPRSSRGDEPRCRSSAPHALKERLDIDVEPGDGAQDLDSENDYAALQIGADSAADFSVTGDAISGAAGQTATAELTFKNNGPAWFGNLGSGDPVAEVRLIVPQGTTVTGVPSGCYPRTLSGGYYPNQKGAPRYDCDMPYWVLENTRRTFAFSVRVDTVVPGATGAVSIHPPYGEFGQYPFTFDPDLTNNTAALTVN
ncbi:hypothetical protein [Streptomyces canarius]